MSARDLVTAVAMIATAACSRHDREPPLSERQPERPSPPAPVQAQVQTPASTSPASTPPVERWPVVASSHLAPAPWPKSGGRWAVARLGGETMQLLTDKPDVRRQISTRFVVDLDGLTYTFGSGMAQHLDFVRVILPGASANPRAARAWFGLPDGDRLPAPIAKQHLEVTMHGDEVEVRAWPDLEPAVDARMRPILLAITALDDELALSNPDDKIYFWFDWPDDNPDDKSLQLISPDGCPDRGDAWLAPYRAEPPTGARRRALKALGFRRVECRWLDIYQSYELM